MKLYKFLINLNFQYLYKLFMCHFSHFPLNLNKMKFKLKQQYEPIKLYCKKY